MVDLSCIVIMHCVLYVCVCYIGKHCLHLAFLHLTPLEYFSKKCDFKVRLNSWKESMPRRLWSISIHVCGNLCSGSGEVNFVLARLRFARFLFSCLVGLEGSVKYSRFLKLKGNSRPRLTTQTHDPDSRHRLTTQTHVTDSRHRLTTSRPRRNNHII